MEDLAGMCPAGFDITQLIKPSSAILRTYGGGVIKPVGQIALMCETQGKVYPLQFQLLSKDAMGSQPPLLSGSDCVKLGLIEMKGSTSPLRQGDPQECARKSEVCHLNESSIEHGAQAQSGTAVQGTMPVSLNDKPREEFKPTDLPSSTYPVNHVCEDPSNVHSTAASESKDKPAIGVGLGMNSSHMPVPCGKLTKDLVMDTFKDVHTGLGTLGPPLHITVNPNVTPIQADPHRCPVAKEAQAAEAIRDLEKQGILKKVTEPTAWISNSVHREKPDGSIRVCIDPSQTINKAIEVPKYPIPTVDELLPKLNNAKIFSCVDVYKGFANIELDESSSYLTTMHTPIGRYRWLRMPFGVSLGPEEYQRRQHEVLKGLKGVVNKADDILVFGCGDSIEEAEKDHEVNLWNLMLRCRKVNLKLNPKKYQFKV